MPVGFLAVLSSLAVSCLVFCCLVLYCLVLRLSKLMRKMPYARVKGKQLTLFCKSQ
jgi:hypothetical protein